MVDDHSYSHHWSERCFYKSQSLPADNILFRNNELCSSVHESADNMEDANEMIDVEGKFDEVPKISSFSWHCSTEKVLNQMEQCYKLTKEILFKKHRDPNWMEKLNKETLSKKGRKKLITTAVQIVDDDVYVRIVAKSTPREITVRKNSIENSALKMRYLFGTFGWDMTLLKWLHLIFINNMPEEQLNSYTEIIQTLKLDCPKLIEKLLKKCDADKENNKLPNTYQLMNRRPWCPAVTAISFHQNKVRLPHPVVFLLVPSVLTDHVYQAESRRFLFWKNLFNNIQNCRLALMEKTVEDNDSITFSDEGTKLDKATKISDICTTTLRKIIWKIRQLRAKFSDMKIVLVGWGSTSLINCYASIDQTVDAIICLGFPTHSLAGSRVNVDDSLCDVTTPTYLVTGTNARSSHPDDVEQFRHQVMMQAITGSLLVNGGNDNLLVNPQVLRQANCSQQIVDKYIWDHVVCFLKTVLDKKRRDMVNSTSSRKFSHLKSSDEYGWRQSEDNLLSFPLSYKKKNTWSRRNCSEESHVFTSNKYKNSSVKRTASDDLETAAAVAAITEFPSSLPNKSKRKYSQTSYDSMSSYSASPTMDDVIASATSRASTYLKKTDDETDKATAFLVDQQPIQAKIHRPRQGIKTRGASSFKTGSTGYSRETFQQTVESSSVTPPVKRGLRTRGGVNSAGPKNTGKRAYNKRKFSESSSSLSNSLFEYKPVIKKEESSFQAHRNSLPDLNTQLNIINKNSILSQNLNSSRFTPVIAPTQTNNIINAPQRKYTSQHKQNLPSKVKMSFGEALNSQPPRDFKVPPQIKRQNIVKAEQSTAVNVPIKVWNKKTDDSK